MEESTLHISRGDKCIVRLTFLLKVTEIIDGRVDFRNKGVKGFVLLVRKPFFKITRPKSMEESILCIQGTAKVMSSSETPIQHNAQLRTQRQ